MVFHNEDCKKKYIIIVNKEMYLLFFFKNNILNEYTVILFQVDLSQHVPNKGNVFVFFFFQIVSSMLPFFQY